MIHCKDGVLLVAVMLFLYMDSHHWFRIHYCAAPPPLALKCEIYLQVFVAV